MTRPVSLTLSDKDRNLLQNVVYRAGLGSGLASCHWEAALTAREATQRKQAGKWQDLTPAIRVYYRKKACIRLNHPKN